MHVYIERIGARSMYSLSNKSIDRSAEAAIHMERPVENNPAANDPHPPNNGQEVQSKRRNCRDMICKLKLRDMICKAWSKLRDMICKFMIRLGVSTAFTLLISLLCWLIYFHPHTFHPEVDSAVLLALDLAGGAPAGAAGGGGGSHALMYDLALNVTFVNKYSMSRIHFNHLTAGLYYGGAKIGPTDDTAPSFKLKKEGSRTVWYKLQGRARNVSDAVAETYARERAQGLFNVNVGLRTKLTYRFFPHKISYYYRYDCWLQFAPVPGDGTPAVTGAFECGRAKSNY